MLIVQNVKLKLSFIYSNYFSDLTAANPSQQLNKIAHAQQVYQEQSTYSSSSANMPGLKPYSPQDNKVSKTSSKNLYSSSNKGSQSQYGSGVVYGSGNQKKGGRESLTQQSYQLPPPPIASKKLAKMTMFQVQMPQQHSYSSSYNANQANNNGYEEKRTGNSQMLLQPYGSSLVSYKIPVQSTLKLY